MGKTIHFVSLGCAKNRVDTEVMLGVSDRSGYRLVDDASDAEVIVVNTCGFIGPAKEESIETVLQMAAHKEEGTCETLVVAGCLSQRYSSELAVEMPEVDHFLGSSDMLKLKAVLTRDELATRAPRVLVGNPADYTLRATDPRIVSGGQHSVYVKIAEGCNRTCSFCAIPGIRGKQRSRPIDDVVREVQSLVDGGTQEVCLVSQDTIGFGRDLADRPDLAELVAAVAEVPGLRWLRLHYLYPEKLRPQLIELLREHPVVLPYIDMPLQHAADPMLTRMRRGHGGERLYRVVERLRTEVPDMVFRTTFIVGHPGETEADFAELQRFVEWAEFDHVGVFLYSHEEDTRSGEMTDLVPEDVVQARHEALMATQLPISRKKQAAFVGREVEVLVDGVSDESDFLMEGRHWGQAPDVDGKVYLANGQATAGQFRRARIEAAADYDLVANLLDGEGAVDAPPGSEPSIQPRIRLKTLS
ncbi:MAG: 30S ribosomal protein S12 methylthiotransferase RimO [Myxococcota bacterium]